MAKIKIASFARMFDVQNQDFIRHQQQLGTTHPARLLASLMMVRSYAETVPANGEAINKALQRVGSDVGNLAKDVDVLGQVYPHMLQDFTIVGDSVIDMPAIPETHQRRFKRLGRFLEMVVDFHRYGKCAKWEKNPQL